VIGLIISLFLVILGLIKYRFNPILLQTVIKVYLLYRIIVFNLFHTFLRINIWSCSSFYSTIINIKFNSISYFMVLIIILVSSCVIINSIDYLSIMESYLFLVYISILQLSMITFVLSNDLIITFLNWDVSGSMSYLLINFWSSKVNCGLKAVVYNKVGDSVFILLLAVFYSHFSFINYYMFLPITLFFNLFHGFLCDYDGLFISFRFIFIFFSKSAQLPFSSRSISATSAPSPVSALPHPSTMVIAGVLFAVLINPTLLMVIDSFTSIYPIIFNIPLFTMLWSLLCALVVSDIKSIIAFPTISQISYMFLALFIQKLNKKLFNSLF